MPLKIRAAGVGLVLIALAFASFVYAQDARNTVEFDGAIQSLSQTAIAINGQVIDISAAQIQAPLAVGAVVRVRAVLLPDASLRAEQISLVPVGMPPGIVEFQGNIERIDAAALILGGQTFDLAAADLDSELGSGDAVRILARAVAPGVWQALDVDRLNRVTAPVVTPEVGAVPQPPARTPEVSAVNPPVSTPEVGDDSGGRGRGRGGDDDSSSGDDDDD